MVLGVGPFNFRPEPQQVGRFLVLSNAVFLKGMSANMLVFFFSSIVSTRDFY